MLSRRRFLQIAGIAAAAASLPRLALDGSSVSAAPSFDTVYGRALSALPVYAEPHADAPLITHLWSDSVTPILGASGGWYRLRQGFARSEGLQPMIAPARRSPAPSAPPFWGEVAGAVAIVRRWCAANAPIVARIGHGGVMHVIEALPGDGLDWYGVADGDGALLGWTQSAVWSPISIERAFPRLTLAVNTQMQHMNVRNGAHLLLSAPISTGRDLPPGVYAIAERRVALTQPTDYHGVPWSLAFGDGLHLTGVYWHNRFGSPTPGSAIQVTPPLAKWLYPRAQKIIIS